MPTTRKQKKSRKSRGKGMLSDIEDRDIMLGGDNPERAQSEFSNSVRRPESPSHTTLVNNDVNSHSNSREDEVRGYARNGRN